MDNKVHYGIIEQLPCGRIRQIGMTKHQQELLQVSMTAISNTTQPFVHVGEEYDLILKAEVKGENKMGKLPLKPLKWTHYVGIDSTFTNEVMRTKTLSHEYVIRVRTDLMYYVDYRRFDTDDDNARKDEPPEFESCKAAAEWVEHTHYPHTMQPYVLTIDEIKKELTQ